MSDLHHHYSEETSAKSIFGVWVYLLSDAVMFAVLFSSYAVLHSNTFGAANITQIATLPFVLCVTYVLLASSLTVGFASVATQNGKKGAAIFWLLVTGVLSVVFMAMIETMLANLYASGNTWHDSAFLSIFYTLIAAHWVHVLIALVWNVMIIFQLFSRTADLQMTTRVKSLGMLTHYVNIIWVFIFAIVFLMGAI